jgi:hypothetical protein
MVQFDDLPINNLPCALCRASLSHKPGLFVEARENTLINGNAIAGRLVSCYRYAIYPSLSSAMLFNNSFEPV